MSVLFHEGTGPQVPTCDDRRGPRSNIYCELPPKHASNDHLGRSLSGRWYSWPQKEEPCTPSAS